MRDEFLHRKEQILSKSDKSFIGGIDEKVKLLCEVINQSNDMYTTSSCSGRVIIKKFDIKKQQNVFLFTTHNEISFHEFEDSLNKLDDDFFPVELLQESLILHVAVRNTDVAIYLMNLAKQSGCNQCGIISVKSYGIFVEIICDIRAQFLVFNKDFIEKNNEYVLDIICLMNENLNKNWSIINKFKSLIE